ncbi:jmjC domain-containing protein 8-like [Gigantopelta aegis]|uniref:jmjC domain-containing protein 8-like n=1 Tax=Gigantopelta aegis TaxID=1735272 RepID=UPI001B88D749|nr:jmjC domain-containing protein 8-like [Gigantopelta aegis]
MMQEIILLLIFVGIKSNEIIDDGGWATEKELLLAQPGPCSIDIREASSLTQQEFVDKYAYKMPVVIRGASDNTKFQDMCRKKSMLSKYGSKKIRLSSANTYSYTKKTLYWFGDNNHTEFAELFNVYKPPPYRVPGMTGVYSFGLAGAGTGVPFHFHGPGFGEVVFGRKRWFMYPPNDEPHFDPNRTTLHWMVEEYPKLDHWRLPLECTIKQGEIIYFPDRWWHGTLNIDTSVFISTFLATV